ncbi:hypothetical protein HHK36_020837 [Tetracentron sinense]|uniref:Uncharacterized protein n=1 Tax=Tetracentron sinense TaxID=13715 RepID=A0A835D8C9_TETSI|nr:hypothetical protein HHK36_020837 [Tetracentron sinense]
MPTASSTVHPKPTTHKISFFLSLSHVWFCVREERRMEGVSANLYKGLKGYWRRKDYERLDGSGLRRKNKVEHATLGSTRRRRFWRIKITPKLRFFHMRSPKKFFLRLRDAYVKMMLGFANSSVFNPGYGGGYGNSVGVGLGRVPLKEYDEKVIVEIYKSFMMAQGQLVPRDAVRLGGEIVI